MRQITVHDLKKMIDDGEDFTLLDIREPRELVAAVLEPMVHIPMGVVPVRIHELDSGKTTVVLCHHGTRAYHVTRYLEMNGFTDAVLLAGGIDAWAKEIDAAVGMY